MIGFGIYVRNEELDILKLTDDRLIKVDPTTKGFFDNILSVVSEDETINEVIKAIQEVKEAKLTPFWATNSSPKVYGNKIIFSKKGGNNNDHSFAGWEFLVKNMHPVEKKYWKIGTEYQYYAFLVYMINLLVEDGCDIIELIKLFFYYSKKEALKKLQDIKENKIYNIVETEKFLKCSNKEVGGFWIDGIDYPIGDITHSKDAHEIMYRRRAWFILV